MQRETLYIKGYPMDMIPNSINRNLQINDFGSAEDRQSNYSNTVKLPMTANNRKVFDFLGVSGNTSRAPYKQLPCTYVVDGIPLITNGHVEIKASTEHYEVVMYDGVIDLAERLKDKKLNDLDYSDLNHYLSQQVYEDSLSNTSGYIYALGDFGIGYSIKADRQVPSVYVHTLWDKIFNEAGVQYVGNFFSGNEDFLSEVITPPLGYEVQDITQTSTAIGSYETDIVSRFEQSNDFTYYEDVLGYNTTFTHPKVTFGIDGQILINEDLQIRLDLDITYNVFESYVNFLILKNGSAIKYITLEQDQGPANESINLSLKAGDILQFKTRGAEHPDTYPDPSNYDTIHGGYTVDYNANATISFSELSGGMLIDFKQLMGDTDCISFIKDVMQRHGLVLKPIKGTQNYEFKQFESLLTNRRDAEDWSDKLSGISKESYGTKYAKVNKAKYKYHDEIQFPTHDGEIHVTDDNAEAEKTLFTSPYQITISKKSYKGEPLYLHPVWEETQDDGQTIIKTKDAPIKCFRVKMVDTTLSYTYFDDAGSYSYAGPVPYLSYEKMDMQYFLNVNYKAYEAVIDNYKEVEASAHLKELDIYNIDFFKLKYLSQTGKYYYLSKVQHKTGVERSKISLIEINRFIQNLPVQVLGSYTYNMSFGSTRTLNGNHFTTYTNPTYYDPESDAPYAIKFISGYNNQVKLYQDGVEIVDDTEILWSELALTLEDMSTTTSAHDVTFEYQIKDEGSKTYGNQVGTLVVSVYEYTNQPPVVDAGENQIVEIDTSATAYNAYASINGTASDADGIETISWTIDTAPFQYTATLNSSNTLNPTLIIPNNIENRGTFTLKLTVTDTLGVSSSDTVTVTVQEGIGGMQPVE